MLAGLLVLTLVALLPILSTVFGMGEYLPNVDGAPVEMDRDNKPVLVAADVEHGQRTPTPEPNHVSVRKDPMDVID